MKKYLSSLQMPRTRMCTRLMDPYNPVEINPLSFAVANYSSPNGVHIIWDATARNLRIGGYIPPLRRRRIRVRSCTALFLQEGIVWED